MKKLSISFASPTQSAMAEKVLTTKNQSALTIRVLSGSQAKQYCKDMTQIRLLVYKEFPYLYQGTFECEAEYLETYFKSPNATVLLVFDHDKVVGFSSSIPLAEEVDDLKEPFIKKGLDLKNYLYINEEGILYPEYRDEGLLCALLEFHENKARQEKYRSTIFMIVDRPENHPLKPKNYQSLDSTWRHFGYEVMPDIKIAQTWTQVDTGPGTANTLSIWEKKIN